MAYGYSSRSYTNPNAGVRYKPVYQAPTYTPPKRDLAADALQAQKDQLAATQAQNAKQAAMLNDIQKVEYKTPAPGKLPSNFDNSARGYDGKTVGESLASTTPGSSTYVGGQVKAAPMPSIPAKAPAPAPKPKDDSMEKLALAQGAYKVAKEQRRAENQKGYVRTHAKGTKAPDTRVMKSAGMFKNADSLGAAAGLSYKGRDGTKGAASQAKMEFEDAGERNRWSRKGEVGGVGEDEFQTKGSGKGKGSAIGGTKKAGARTTRRSSDQKGAGALRLGDSRSGTSGMRSASASKKKGKSLKLA